MPKIKDILEKIKNQGNEYHALRLMIAKRVWILFASLYFLAKLFTVGGFYVGNMSLVSMSKMVFYLYIVMTIATGWMIYEIGEYAIMVRFPEKKWLLIIPGLLGIALSTVVIVFHLGII